MDIDVTLLVQLGIFVTLLVTLNGLLFQPFLKLMEERHQRTQGTRDEIDRLSHEEQADREIYVKRINEARQKAQNEREALVATAKNEERQMLAKLRDEIAAGLNKARDDLAKEEDRVRTALQADASALSRQLVEKMLGRELAS